MKKKVMYGVITGAVAIASVGTVAALTTAGLSQGDGEAVATIATTDGISTDELVDEIVYVFMNPDGSVRKTISSDWTKNDLGTDAYTKTTGKVSTPITVKVSYFLDGQATSPSELSGKSGRVKIRYDYTNTDTASGMHVPYAVLSGLVLSNDHFSNVSATNGKIVNDGSRIVVAGVALPGLTADLGLSGKIDLPEYLEIEADAKDFKMEMTMSIATSSIFAELDTSALDTVDGLSSQLDTLTSAMNQLLDGSAALYDGLDTLNEKTGVLADGVGQLKDGSSALASGSKALAAGMAEVLGGARKIDSGVDTAIAQVSTLADKLGELNASSETLSTAAEAFFSGTIAKLQQNPLLSTLTEGNYETVLATAIKNLTEVGDTATAAELTTTLSQLKFYQGVIGYVGGASQIADAAAAVPTALTPLKTGSSSLVAGLSTIVEKTNELASGMATLDAGVSNLSGNVPALVEGVSKLASGSKSLTDGLTQFNDEGVKKLVSLYNGDISSLTSRVRTIVNLAKTNSRSKIKYIYRTDEIK